MKYLEEFTWKHHSKINLEIKISNWKFHQITFNVSKVIMILPSWDLSFQVENYIAKLKAKFPTL